MRPTTTHTLASLAAAALLALSVTARAAVPADAPPAPPAGATATDTVDDNKIVVDDKTEVVIRGALKWMASKQQPNGAWNAGGGEHAVAMTGYTVMAFLSAGSVPGEGEYGKAVDKGVNYLLDCVGPDGYVHFGAASAGGSGGSNMYGHGVACIALGEVYGMSRDPRLKAKLEQAVKLIVSCQNDQGGWRYAPRKSDADLSASVLQIVALRCAKNSGLDVPQATLDNAVKYVKSCFDEGSGGFTYQPRNHNPGFARSAAGIYCLQVCGLYDDPMVKRGSDYIEKHRDNTEWFTYGHFYAAPAQYMIGGKTWRDWYGQMNQKLLAAVKREGDFASWEPIDHKVGALYATAVYTTILSMPYHYVPLYQR